MIDRQLQPPGQARRLKLCLDQSGDERLHAPLIGSAKLHQRLGDLEVKYAVRIEAPEPPRGSQGSLF